MLHVGVPLLALFVLVAMPCGQVEQRVVAWEPLVWEDPLIHVHVVVFGKVFCADPDFSNIPSTVSLELGNRDSSPSDFRTLNSTSFQIPAGGKDFALAGDYSYNPRANCLPGKPRVIVSGHCGYAEVYDIKPAYEGHLDDKKHRLEIYNLGDIHPVVPV